MKYLRTILIMPLLLAGTVEAQRFVKKPPERPVSAAACKQDASAWCVPYRVDIEVRGNAVPAVRAEPRILTLPRVPLGFRPLMQGRELVVSVRVSSLGHAEIADVESQEGVPDWVMERVRETVASSKWTVARDEYRNSAEDERRVIFRW